MLRTLSAFVLTFAIQLPGPTQEIDPAFQALADRFFAAQQAEDPEAYLALWSRSATKPTIEQLRFVFTSGDDTFTDVSVLRAQVTGETARIRVAATRVRTDMRFKGPDGSARTFTTRLQLAVALVREEGEWRIVREGPPSDELAVTLIETADPEVRRRLLEADPELVNLRLVDAISQRADQLAQAARYKAAGLPKPPNPTRRTRAFSSFS